MGRKQVFKPKKTPVVQDPVDSDIEDESEEEQVGNVAWGQKREEYHGRDVSDESSSDEEAAQDEEEEARRLLQSKLTTLRDDDFSIAPPAQSSTAAKATKKSAHKKPEDAAVEQIEKNLDALSTSEKLRIIEQDSPQLLQLLKDLKEKLSELQNQVQPALQRLKEEKLPTAQGLSFLEVKNQQLLLYCINIMFYLYLKASGESVKDHPVVEQLARLRTTLEKMKPLDQKLKYQIDKLLKKAADGAASEARQAVSDKLAHKPRPEDMVAKADEEGDSGVYKPPKMAAMPYDGDEPSADRKQRLRDEKRKRNAEKLLAKELRNEFGDRPEEIADNPFEVSDEEADEVKKFEESMMTRLERKKRDAKKPRVKFGDAFAEFADFGDAIVEEDESHQKTKSLRRIISRIDQAAHGKQLQSGEQDVPYKNEQAAKRRAVTAMDNMSDDDHPAPAPVEDDEFYQAAQEAQQRKRKQKAADKEASKPKPVFFDDSVAEGSKRGATTKMIKNKGLTPARPLKMRNPRVRMREAYESAVKRRKGQVRTMREEGKVYGGEATGIRSNVSRSVKLGT